MLHNLSLHRRHRIGVEDAPNPIGLVHSAEFGPRTVFNMAYNSRTAACCIRIMQYWNGFKISMKNRNKTTLCLPLHLQVFIKFSLLETRQVAGKDQERKILCTHTYVAYTIYFLLSAVWCDPSCFSAFGPSLANAEAQVAYATLPFSLKGL